jgi:hypothetical protein
MVVVADAGFIKGLGPQLLVKAELGAVRPDGCQLREMEYQVPLIQAALAADVVQIMPPMVALAV